MGSILNWVLRTANRLLGVLNDAGAAAAFHLTIGRGNRRLVSTNQSAFLHCTNAAITGSAEIRGFSEVEQGHSGPDHAAGTKL
jgi:hypothetical protein